MTNEEAIDVLKHNYPSMCFTDLCEAVDIAIEALSEQPEPQWIPCSERLPEKNGDYLCSLGDDEHSIEVDTFAEDHFEIYNVIAWMPLPEPYKP